MTSPFLPPMHADMILAGLFLMVFICRASPFNMLFQGTEPRPIQPVQATFEEFQGQSELVTGREKQQ